MFDYRLIGVCVAVLINIGVFWCVYWLLLNSPMKGFNYNTQRQNELETQLRKIHQQQIITQQTHLKFNKLISQYAAPLKNINNQASLNVIINDVIALLQKQSLHLQTIKPEKSVTSSFDQLQLTTENFLLEAYGGYRNCLGFLQRLFDSGWVVRIKQLQMLLGDKVDKLSGEPVILLRMEVEILFLSDTPHPIPRPGTPGSGLG